MVNLLFSVAPEWTVRVLFADCSKRLQGNNKRPHKAPSLGLLRVVFLLEIIDLQIGVSGGDRALLSPCRGVMPRRNLVLKEQRIQESDKEGGL